jgi:hypothetical protein
MARDGCSASRFARRIGLRFADVSEPAGLPDAWTIHDLRKTATPHWQRLANAHSIAPITSHKPLKSPDKLSLR